MSCWITILSRAYRRSDMTLFQQYSETIFQNALQCQFFINSKFAKIHNIYENIFKML